MRTHSKCQRQAAEMKDVANGATNEEPEPTTLVKLPPDTLRLILLHITDELSLLRVSTVCRALRAPAREPALWSAALANFFDGELPPELVGAADPLHELRQQVLCAVKLTELERQHRRFLVAPVKFAGTREWMEQLDNRVAERQISQGGTYARPGIPYYGCSGGAYSTTTKCFGQYAKGTIVNSCAATMGLQGAQLVAWARTDMKAVAKKPDSRVRASGIFFDGDYGPLAEWKDAKIIELAETAGKARLAALRKDEMARARRAKPMLYSSLHPDVNPSKGPPKALAEGALSVPKLLAGSYGGLFSFQECGTSIGTIYALTCQDGTSIADYSEM